MEGMREHGVVMWGERAHLTHGVSEKKGSEHARLVGLGGQGAVDAGDEDAVSGLGAVAQVALEDDVNGTRELGCASEGGKRAHA